MKDNTLIYIAGNPELYPIEYYDADTGTYQGAIPGLLSDFAEASGYEIVYYHPGSSDERANLAENIQVDAISAMVTGESFANTEGMLPLFTAETADGRVEYGLAFTPTAPESFVTELTAFIKTRSESAVIGEILAAVDNPPTEAAPLLPVVVGLGVVLCLALAALLAVVQRSIKRSRSMERERYTDPGTALLSQAGFEKAFHETVNEDNRVLYYMICFHFELGHIERVSGPGELTYFQRFVADILRRHAGGNEIISRANNGDFFVLCQDDNISGAQEWALAALEEIKTYTYAGAALNKQDASVGIFPLSARDQDFEHMLYHARQCAISAGRDERGAKICGAENCQICEEERELLSDLERGLKHGEFQLNLQLVVSSDDFSIMGGEVLSRWQHPKRGLLSPDRFIPLLEREGRIDRLDLYNLDKSCAFLQQICQVRKDEFYLACNFSRRSFAQPELISHCREIIERYSFPRRCLIIEITESGLIKSEDAPQMRENIRAIRSLGVQVMFDDFGLGYTTFHDLQEYPMDGLKLDKSLIDNMGTDRGRIIIDGIVRTGHELGLIILAEGVEEQWQVNELKKLNCDLLQGYLFSLPIPASEMLRRVSGTVDTF